jgi:hypothetical protein
MPSWFWRSLTVGRKGTCKTPYKCRVWITLIKLPVTLLVDEVIGSFMHEDEWLYGRLLPLLPITYENQCSHNLSAYQRYKRCLGIKGF